MSAGSVRVPVPLPGPWSIVHLGDLAQEANVVPEFAEGCPCHGPYPEEEDESDDEEDDDPNAGPNANKLLRKLCPGPTPLPSECSFKGCRAPEMALNRGLSIQRMKLEEDREPCPLWRALVWWLGSKRCLICIQIKPSTHQDQDLFSPKFLASN